MYQGPLAVLYRTVDTMVDVTEVNRRDVGVGQGVPKTPPPSVEADRTSTVDTPRWERAADYFVDWRSGNTRAMDDLVRLMSPVLWHVVRAYGLDRALAEDVVQTTWLTLVRTHATITDPRAISGWLTICARREAWRVGKAHRRADATEPESLEPLMPQAESAEQVAELGDRDGRLWRAVSVLDARCQRLLRIVAFEERPDYAQIAKDLSMPIGSIGPTRKRCLGKLRGALRDAGWGGDDE